jgi:hypothetical protein
MRFSPPPPALPTGINRHTSGTVPQLGGVLSGKYLENSGFKRLRQPRCGTKSDPGFDIPGSIGLKFLTYLSLIFILLTENRKPETIL